MARISWGSVGSRFYETGVDRGVLYVEGLDGVPWNGLSSLTETVSGGAAKPYYVDGEKYLNNSSREEFAATLTAYTYPDEFQLCDGTAEVRPGFLAKHQRRKFFGLSYRNMLGNDITTKAGYKIHLIYGVLAAPSSKVHKTISTAQDPDDFSWTLSSLPPLISGFKRTSHFVIDSRTMDPTMLGILEDILYGTDTDSSRLPDVVEIVDLIDSGDRLTVVDNGDGTATLTAPMAELVMLDLNTYQLTWSTVVEIDVNTYTISSS